MKRLADNRKSGETMKNCKTNLRVNNEKKNTRVEKLLFYNPLINVVEKIIYFDLCSMIKFKP